MMIARVLFCKEIASIIREEWRFEGAFIVLGLKKFVTLVFFLCVESLDMLAGLKRHRF
jgi:hypothetical protein